MAKTLNEVLAERQSKIFVDYKQLVPLFKEWLLAPKLPKRLMLIYGVGGSGKTVYLFMLENVSREQNIPVGFVSGRGWDGILSAVDILRRWARGLDKQNVILPNFEKALLKYDAIRSRVERIEQLNTSQDFDRTLLEILKKDEIGLFVDPTNILTDKFLFDLSKVARETRIV
jgi:hypothetical protein